jgi:hypothetical protein
MPKSLPSTRLLLISGFKRSNYLNAIPWYFASSGWYLLPFQKREEYHGYK